MNLKEIKVEEFTTPSVYLLGPEASLDDALELMQEHGIRHLPVLDQGEVVGIVSERDILTHIGKQWDKMIKIEDIMSTSVLTVHASDNLGDVAYALSSNKKGSAIVLDENDELYGIFTTTDALNALVEIFCPEAAARSEIQS